MKGGVGVCRGMTGQDPRGPAPEAVRTAAGAGLRRPGKAAVPIRAVGQGCVATEVKVKTVDPGPAEVAGAGLSEKGVFDMPGFDGTGPQGAGPMTGGARGYCNPATAGYGPRYGIGQGYGRGLGRGRGFGRGLGPGYGRGFGPRAYAAVPGAAQPPLDSAQELNMLKSEADGLKRALDDIHDRIEELEKTRPE